MKFDKLHGSIPYVTGGKSKILTMHPYNAITLALPGRHANQTDPPGGDFVVMVDDDNMDWTAHQFTHADLFKDMEIRTAVDPSTSEFILRRYADIVWNGDDPEKISPGDEAEDKKIPGCMHPKTFLYAVQCLAIAEHRRYHKHETKFGGRFLPFRCVAGIVEGKWTALDAAERTRRLGRPGVEWLERQYGMPAMTKQLMGK